MIIFDLDGTLADCEHRRHLVDKTKNLCYMSHEPLYGHPDTRYPFVPQWKAFYEACDQDKPISATVDVLNNLLTFTYYDMPSCEVEIWSGRSEAVRLKTLLWLDNNLPNTRGFPLKMRPINDNTPDDELKEKWLDEALAQGKTIEYVFDDRPKVIRMWRRRGIFVFNCNQTGDEF